MPKGRIINLNGGNYQILTDDKEVISAKASGRLRYQKVCEDSSFNKSTNKLSKKTSTTRIKLSPKVGDFVNFEFKDGNNYIVEVLPRQNSLIRPDIANVDQIILVFAAKEPTFSFYLLDMFLVNIIKANIEPVIIISKSDLLSEDEYIDLRLKMDYYEKIGFKVLFVNSLNLKEREQLLLILKDKVSVLSGQTGAGKSTLINAIIPGFSLNTNAISKALGRGKHTTREVTIYNYNDILIGDTPGFSKFDLSFFDLKEDELKNLFIEFKDYNCKFNDCMHLEKTKGCGVYEAYVDKKILSSRYLNYLKMRDEIMKNRGNGFVKK